MARKSKKAAEKAKKKAKAGQKSSGQKPSGKRTWKFMDRGATVVGGMIATRATNVAWRGLSGKKPPKTGRHPDVSTREAVLWAMVGGGLTELIKTGVRRGTATYWVRSTGELPPGMKSLAAQPKDLKITDPEVQKANKRDRPKRA